MPTASGASWDGPATTAPAPAYAASAPITVTGCANSASVQGGSCAGGIVGTFYNAGTVSGNTNTAASITSSSFAGGIVGNLQNADISSLPSTIPEGILVENNVSTTPLNAITAPLKGPYAYNNTPSDFTVRDNGSAWVAQTGATRYATLAGAFATAPDHSTIKLVSSVSEQPTLSVSDGRELTLDLAGFNLFFATDGGLSLRDGALTVTGQGDVATAEGAPTASPSPLATVSGTGSLALKGGSYNQDVAPYVADSYAEFVPADAHATAPFSVVPASTAKHNAQAVVHDGGKTVYYGDAGAARTAAAAAPWRHRGGAESPEHAIGQRGRRGQPERRTDGNDKRRAAERRRQRECRGQDRWQHRSRRPDRRQRGRRARTRMTPLRRQPNPAHPARRLARILTAAARPPTAAFHRLETRPPMRCSPWELWPSSRAAPRPSPAPA